MDFSKEVEGNLCFFLQDGRVLKSINELLETLKSLGDDVFTYHVNVERNDFANWVKEVFKAKALALKIKKCTGREELIKLFEAEKNGKKGFKKKGGVIRFISPPSRNKEKVLQIIKSR
jgi:hypothetical protein